MNFVNLAGVLRHEINSSGEYIGIFRQIGDRRIGRGAYRLPGKRLQTGGPVAAGY